MTKITDYFDKRDRKLARQAAWRKNFQRLRTTFAVAAKASKVAFHSFTAAFAFSAAVYFAPVEDVLPEGTPDSVSDTIKDFRENVRDIASWNKERAERTIGHLPEFLAMPSDLSAARGRLDTHLEKFTPIPDGSEGAKLEMPNNWRTACLGIGGKSWTNILGLSEDQQKLSDYIERMKMSPTARHMIAFAENKDVYLCMKDLEEGILGEYSLTKNLIFIDTISTTTIGHEGRHHWQGQHHLMYGTRPNLSAHQALNLLLAIEADARVIGAVIDREIEVARKIGGDGYQASFEEIIDHEGLLAMRRLMQDTYRDTYNNATWLSTYVARFVASTNGKSSRSVNSDTALDETLRTQDFPIIGHVEGYGNYMTSELIDLSFKKAKDSMTVTPAQSRTLSQ